MWGGSATYRLLLLLLGGLDLALLLLALALLQQGFRNEDVILGGDGAVWREDVRIDCGTVGGTKKRSAAS